MFEALESRQLFSVTLTATDPTAAPAPIAPIEVDAATTQMRKAGGSQQDYMVVTLKEVYVAGWSTSSAK